MKKEFLSEYGIRGLSKYHEKNPYVYKVGDTEYKVKYNPRESDNHLFGGNSNWRGPIWFPVNYRLWKLYNAITYFYGDSFKIEVPTGSGRLMNLKDAASELERRLASLFKMGKDGNDPIHDQQKDIKKDNLTKIWFSSMSTFMVIMVEGLVPTTKPVGQPLLRKCKETWHIPEEEKKRLSLQFSKRVCI